jgi:DDE superfamily endonuclease
LFISVIQPMDQGIIATFKMYYLRKSFQHIFRMLEKNNELSFTDAWKTFSMKDCILYVSLAISEIRQSTLNACWKSLWPECVESEKEKTDNATDYSEIINLARSVYAEEFLNLTREDVDNILYNQVLDDEDLIEMVAEQVESDDSTDTEVLEQPIEPKTIKEGLTIATQLENHFVTIDPDSQPVRNFQKNLKSCMLKYNELYKDLLGPKTSNQRLITDYMGQAAKSIVNE